MAFYIAKRILTIIPVVLVLSVIVFLIIYLIPGDPAAVMLGDGTNPETVAALRTQLGLDLPLLQQYTRWIGQALTGDLGDSFFMKQSVVQALREHLGPTLSLALLAEVIALAVAIPLGIRAAVKRGEAADKMLTGFTLFGITVPGFVLSMFTVLLFSVQLKWLPVSGYKPLSAGLWTHLKYLLLPALSLGVVQAAVLARVTRSAVLEVLGENYIKTALSKGMSDRMIVYKHVLRNALIPILTVIGGSFGTLIAGAAVIETIFNIPGMGQMLVNSVQRRDYTVIQGIILFVAVTYVLVNLIVDLLYAAVDPRIRLK
ncbi:ABC transporter permease [Paenibacillus riograndensis]|uniref:ABC transporter permease n=1 Tax=Paenibacillus riograndensis SBR5 TaxID=1073571 RepID=A0A0E4HA43_9BACL|nr:ABC transporter permease [Paenibacillus riograndensis]CQR55621.1 ABC transporter permease [Paenibacillus riograndensis SBR5]